MKNQRNKHTFLLRIFRLIMEKVVSLIECGREIKNGGKPLEKNLVYSANILPIFKMGVFITGIL